MSRADGAAALEGALQFGLNHRALGPPGSYLINRAQCPGVVSFTSSPGLPIVDWITSAFLARQAACNIRRTN